jgi:hypothetical protein
MPVMDNRERPARRSSRIGRWVLLLPLLSACGGPASPGALSDVLPAPSTASRPPLVRDSRASTCRTLDDRKDYSNELLAINNRGVIAGGGSPLGGYLVYPPYRQDDFKNAHAKYPGAVFSVVTSLNDEGTLAGWYLNSKGQTFGFTKSQKIFTSYQEPHTRGGSTQVTEILAITDGGAAIGYYEDGKQILHAFELNTVTGKFTGIEVPGAVNSVATGINGRGDIVGWLTLHGVTEGWLLKGGVFTFLNDPSSVSTSPMGINSTDDIVGSYTDASSNTHGFILTKKTWWQEIDEPKTQGETVVTGINDHRAMVGFYKDSSGNLNGFFCR